MLYLDKKPKQRFVDHVHWHLKFDHFLLGNLCQDLCGSNVGVRFQINRKDTRCHPTSGSELNACFIASRRSSTYGLTAHGRSSVTGANSQYRSTVEPNFEIRGSNPATHERLSRLRKPKVVRELTLTCCESFKDWCVLCSAIHHRMELPERSARSFDPRPFLWLQLDVSGHDVRAVLHNTRVRCLPEQQFGPFGEVV